MKYTLQLFFILFAFQVQCLGQRASKVAIPLGACEVIISNFHLSPPNCGFDKTISIYEAEMLDSTKNSNGEKFLICIECKKEKFPIIKGNIFVVTTSGECVYYEGVYNFTSYTTDELKNRKIHKIISVRESR